MATSGETYGRNLSSAACFERFCFSSDPLFHLQVSQFAPSVFPFYEESLNPCGEMFDFAESMNDGKKIGPISRPTYTKRKDADALPVIKCAFQNTREDIHFVQDCLKIQNALPSQQCNLKYVMSSQDAYHDANKFSSRKCKDYDVLNFVECRRPSRAVPLTNDVYYSTDIYMVSNQFHQSSSSDVTSSQKKYASDVSWSSFATTDPLNQLTRFQDGLIDERHSKISTIHKTLDKAVEDKFVSAFFTTDKQRVKVPERLNCKPSTVLHSDVKTGPLIKADSSCVSEVATRNSNEPYQQTSCGLDDRILENSNINGVQKTSSLEARFPMDDVSASNLENSSISPSACVRESRSGDSGRESLCGSNIGRTAINKKPSKEKPFFDSHRFLTGPSMKMPQKACSESAKPTIETTEFTEALENEIKTKTSDASKNLAERKTSRAEQDNDSVLNNRSLSLPHSGQSLDHCQMIRNDLSDNWKHKNIHTNGEHQEANESARIHRITQLHATGDKAALCRKIENEFTQNAMAKDPTVVSKSKKMSSYLAKSRKIFLCLAKIDKGKIFGFFAWLSHETSLLIVNLVKLLMGVILYEDAESEFKDFLNSTYGSAEQSNATAAGPFGRSAYSPNITSTGSSSGSKRRRRKRR